MGFKLKQFFCKHHFVVKKAVFQYGKSIPPIASKELTRKTDWMCETTDYHACPNTEIKTFFVVEKPYVFLFCKECDKCGIVKSCDAFAYEEYKQFHEILSSEGL